MIYPVKMPIMLFPYKEHNYKKETLLDIIENTPKGSITEEDTIISETDYFLNDGLNKKYIEILGEDFFRQIDNAFCEINHGPWSTQVAWVQSYLKNETHSWHKHHSCLWACVYYLELPKDSPGTLMKNPITNEIFDLGAKEGDVIIFPSQIVHCSPPNTSNQRKTIIGLNIDIPE